MTEKITENSEKKVGFWTYYLALNFGPNEVQGAAGKMWAPILSMLLLIWGVSFVGGSAIPFTLCFFAFAYLTVIALCITARVRPSLFNLLPIGGRRKTGFFFLSVLLTAVLSLVIFAVVLTVFFLIIALIVLVSSGEWIFVFEESEAPVMTCWQGELLALILGVGIVGAGMIASCLKKKSLRITFTLLIPIIAVAPFIVIMQLGGIAFGQLFILFDVLPYYYIYLIVFGALAVALLAVGVVRMIGFLNPKIG